MSRHKEVNHLLNKMSENSSECEVPAAKLEHHLLPDIDVAPHRKAKAWPGTSYMLMGNSFNLEPEHDPDKRSVALAGLFSRSPKGTVTIGEALKNDEFNQVLSRFETDWLSRLNQNTVIGPAFDINGRALDRAFAVWRPVSKVRNASKVLAQV